MIHPVYPNLFESTRGEEGEDALEREYLRPNEAFFRSYVAFMTQGKMSWDSFVSDFGKRWGSSPEEVRSILGRIAEHYVEALARRGVSEARRVLSPEAAEVHLYLCVGLEWSNAFMVVVKGEPAVAIGLEAETCWQWNRRRRGVL